MAKELIEHVNPKDLTIIGLDTEDGPEHPLYDERIRLDIDENLVKNIQVYGILQPVTVRKEAGAIFVVDGRQRVRAARKASEQASSAGEYGVKVPTRTVSVGDDRAAGIMISTGLRQNDGVLTSAIKAERLLARLGDIEEVALAFGKSITTIRNWTLLAAAGPIVHQAVLSGKISAGAAIELVRSVDREDVAEALEGLLNKHTDPVSVAQAKLAVAKAAEADSAAANAIEAATDTGDNAASAPAKTEVKKKTTTSEPKQQVGIRRVWLRRALTTEAAEHLAEEHRALLQWFATGESAKGTWYDDFVFDAEAEMESGLQSKADKAAGKTPKPAALPEPLLEPEAQEELNEKELLAELRDIVNTPLPDDENTDENTDKEE